MAASAGDQELFVSHTAGFSIGDRIIIDEGTGIEEVNTVAGFASILLSGPLQFAHPVGFTVRMTPATPNGVPSIAPTAAPTNTVPFGPPGTVDQTPSTLQSSNNDGDDGSLSAGAIAAVVIGSVVLLIAFVRVWRRSSTESDWQGASIDRDFDFEDDHVWEGDTAKVNSLYPPPQSVGARPQSRSDPRVYSDAGLAIV